MSENKIKMIKGSMPEVEVDSEVVRKEICTALQVENLNFLIGAGCSSYRVKEGDVVKELGISAMNALLKSSKSLIRNFELRNIMSLMNAKKTLRSCWKYWSQFID